MPMRNHISWINDKVYAYYIKDKHFERMRSMNNKVIFLTTDSLGDGDKELGAQLLETYVNLLKQREALPAAVFCVNRGVLALTEQSFASLHLKELEDKGVPVLACGTCVDYYKIHDKLVAGKVSSMGYFMELSEKYEVMTIS